MEISECRFAMRYSISIQTRFVRPFKLVMVFPLIVIANSPNIWISIVGLKISTLTETPPHPLCISIFPGASFPEENPSIKGSAVPEPAPFRALHAPYKASCGSCAKRRWQRKSSGFAAGHISHSQKIIFCSKNNAGLLNNVYSQL